jgi:hypothetical protein
VDVKQNLAFRGFKDAATETFKLLKSFGRDSPFFFRDEISNNFK